MNFGREVEMKEGRGGTQTRIKGETISDISLTLEDGSGQGEDPCDGVEYYQVSVDWIL